MKGSISNRELALYMGVLLAAAATRVAVGGGPQLFNDSYQYLSVVENLRVRGAISTSIIHFDTERTAGYAPAPATTFAPGYPLAIWALSWTRIRLEWIALGLSLFGALGVLPLLRTGASAIGLGATAARACLLVWALSAQVAQYATSVLAEAVFTFVTLSAVLLLITASRAPAGRGQRSVALAYLLGGLSCWLRYAGLFLVLAFHFYAAIRIWRERENRASWIGSLLLCDVVVGVLLGRNIASAGTWRGGNERALRNGLGYVLHRLGDAGYEVALGSIQKPVPLGFALFATLVAGGVLVALVMVSRSWIGISKRPLGQMINCAGPLVGSAGAYCAGMCYVGFTTQISLGARMFVPILPEMLLVAGLIWSRTSEFARPSVVWKLVATSLLGTGFLGGNLCSLVRPPHTPAHRIVADAFALPTGNGVPLLRWTATSIPADAVVFAVEGQATGYVLGRKTVSATGRAYTTARWDEEEVRRTMQRFGADYLITYPQTVGNESVGRVDSEFLGQLGRREAPPWLRLVAENPRVLVFRSQPSSPKP